MDFIISELTERTGVPARTIRYYVSVGLLPRPQGAGLAARYSELHLLRLFAITALRRENLPLDDIRARIEAMSKQKLRSFVPKEPRTENVAHDLAEVAAASDASGEESAKGEPAPKKLGGSKALDVTDLPLGASWIIAPLLPGLAVMVRADAPAVVRRIASEITRRYGASVTDATQM